MTSFSNVLQNSFKVIYRDQTTIETSTLLAICIFKPSSSVNFSNKGSIIICLIISFIYFYNHFIF